MIGEISRSINDSVRERIVSPLFGAFLFSWCVWNYKLILVIFSDLGLVDKIIFIEGNLYPDILTGLSFGIAYPFASAVLFIIFYPYPSRWLYSYWAAKQKALREVRQKIEDQSPLTKEESRSLRRKAHQMVRHAEEQLAERDEEISSLKSTVEVLEYEKEKLQSELDGIRDSGEVEGGPSIEAHLELEKDALIHMLAVNNSIVPVDQVEKMLDVSSVKADYIVDSLLFHDYVTVQHNSMYGREAISLTRQGRKYAVEMGLAD